MLCTMRVWTCNLCTEIFAVTVTRSDPWTANQIPSLMHGVSTICDLAALYTLLRVHVGVKEKATGPKANFRRK
jgi:hypothetical protein